MPIDRIPAFPIFGYRRNANPNTASPHPNTDISEREVLAVKWLKPDESIARLESIIAELKKVRIDTSIQQARGVINLLIGFEVSADAVKQTKLMFFDIFLFLLTSHLATVKHLNSAQSITVMQKLIGSENITCDIPWDETSGLPPHPTLAADAKSYPKIFKPEDNRITALCESFSGWSLYAVQKELCACNSRLKVNELTIEILVNHILKADHGDISIRQLIGLRSKDLRRLEKHYYEDKVPSRFVDSLLIISDVSETFSLKTGFKALAWATNPPEQFKIDKFQKQIGVIVESFLRQNRQGKSPSPKATETKGG